MRITKYEHACLDVEVNSNRIVIDPGVFSSSFTNFGNISALVITHIHPDHYSPETTNAIVTANPAIQIFTTQEIAEDLKDSHVQVPEVGKVYKVGETTLEFYGGKHAEIDPELPVNQNYGVLVNNQLYYPGDSFTECDKPFEVLAVPSSAPWMKVSEMIPMIKNSRCKVVFPTHNALLSEIGDTVTNNNLQRLTERNNKKFTYLKPTESIEV